MKKFRYFIYVCFFIISKSYAQDYYDKLSVCNENFQAIQYSDSLFEDRTLGRASGFLTKNKDLNLNAIIGNCQFEILENQTNPTYFNSENYNLWICLKVFNPYDVNKNILLSGDMHSNKYYVIGPNKMDSFLINNLKIESSLHHSYLNGRNKTIVELEPKQLTFIVINQSKAIYNFNGSFPLISNADQYETNYLYKYNFVIKFFLIASTYSFTFLFLALLFYFLFKRSEFLLYCLYLLVIFMLSYRNYEWVDLYTEIRIGRLSWYYTKVFETSLLFLSYTLFIYKFLSLDKTIAKKSLTYVKIIIITACILEVFCLNFLPVYSYLVYFILRNLLSVIGIVFIFIVFRSLNPYSKYILSGAIILISFDLLSNIAHGPESSVISTLGTVIEVILFNVAIALWALHLYKEKIREVNDSKLAILQKNETIASMRKEFAQDLHDDLGSSITKLNLEVYYEQQKNKTTNPILSNVKAKLETMSLQIKDMIWLFDEDKSTLLELQSKIRQTANEMIENLPIEIQFNFKALHIDVEIPLDVKRHIIAIVKEAITNVLKHSKATHINLSCNYEKNTLNITIMDNGIGIHPTNESKGNGLTNMKNRIKKINGSLEVYATLSGTKVDAFIPIENTHSPI